jgi:hypothetical protein
MNQITVTLYLTPIQQVSRCALLLARNARVILRLCRMHSETAVELVTRKHANPASRGPQTRIEPTREFCLSQGGFFPCQVEFIPC